MAEERSEVNYRTWRWDSEDNKEWYKMQSFIIEKEKEGYTIIQNKIENTGYASGYNLHFSRGSIIYYKAKPNDESIERLMSFDNSITRSVTIEEEKGHRGDTGTWHIDDTNDFENGLKYLTRDLESFLNAGYIVMGTTFKTYGIDDEDDEDDEDEEIVTITINIHLQRSASAQDFLRPIRAEKKRKDEEQLRLRVEEIERQKRERREQQERIIQEQEDKRQQGIVNKAKNIFEPNYNHKVKYTNLHKAGTRSRRKRTQPKQRKTRNKKRS